MKIHLSLDSFTRIEVIDETERVFVKYLSKDQIMEPSYQDNYRTLKIFIKKKEI